jgi:NADPH-dependent F420 reductase
MKKTVAVIGADGRMGAALAFRLTAAGYRTLVTTHDPQDRTPLVGKLPLLVAKIRLHLPQADGGMVFSAREASWEADIVIPVVSYELQATVASEIRNVVTGKIVISVTNPLNDCLDGLLTPPTTSAAEELAGLLPHSKVVKAFNTLSAMDVETPQTFGGQTADVFVAGDDDEAVSTVMQLVRETGFHPLFAGRLAVSRTLESMMLLLANLSIRNDANSLAAWKVLQGATSTRES